MKTETNTRNAFGVIDTSDEGRKKFYAKILHNRSLPYKGMKYFPEYSMWAVNEKNVMRKAGIKKQPEGSKLFFLMKNISLIIGKRIKKGYLYFFPEFLTILTDLTPAKQ